MAQNQKEKIYFQAFENLINKAVLERETQPLREINDNCRKALLSLDKRSVKAIGGIEIKNIID